MSMNAQHLTFGIVTYDRDKAERKLHDVVQEIVSGGDEVIRIVRSKTDLFAKFKSGKSIKWVNPIWRARGYRLHGAYVDETLRDTEDFIDAVIVKMDGYNEYGLHWF